MNFLFLFYRIAQKTPTFVNKIIFYFLNVFIPPIRKKKFDPFNYLNSIYPDNGKSSLGKNKVNDNPKYDVQIIVPVYNVEKYLEECLNSIINQNTKYKFCIVAVNDGSTDGSMEILKKYEKFSNFKIINQENRGLSGARNAALKKIDADYVMFVDSDDFLYDGALEALLDCAKNTNVDIVQGNYSYYWNDGRIQGGRFIKKGFCNPQSLFGFACGKLYKAVLWKNFCFPEKYWFEDTINRIVLFNIAKTAFVTDSMCFFYRQNMSGISSSSKGNKKTIDTVWVTKKLIEDYKNISSSISKDVYAVFIKQFLFNYSRILTLNNRNIDYASFLLYCDIFQTVDIDLSSFPFQIRTAYKCLKERNFKKFLLCSFLLR